MQRHRGTEDYVTCGGHINCHPKYLPLTKQGFAIFMPSSPGNNMPPLPDVAGRLLASQTSPPRGSPSSSHLEGHFLVGSTCLQPLNLRPMSIFRTVLGKEKLSLQWMRSQEGVSPRRLEAGKGRKPEHEATRENAELRGPAVLCTWHCARCFHERARSSPSAGGNRGSRASEACPRSHSKEC